MLTTGAGFVEMRIGKVVGFGPPLAEHGFECVVLDELHGDRHLVIDIGEKEAFSLAAILQDLAFGRPMTYQFTAALLTAVGGRVRQVRLDRLVDGAYAATVEVGGPLGAHGVDARASDALNLAAITGTPVFASADVLDDAQRRQTDGSAQARLLSMAPAVPQMIISRQPQS